jgi:hypothetical protein
MTGALKSALNAFRRDEKGSFTVEAVVIFPLLVWAYTAMFVFWDAYKAENLAMKGAYTIADMISREVVPIDEDYIDGLNSIFGFLTGLDPTNEIRVSVVRMVTGSGGEPELDLVWSHATSTRMPALTDVQVIEDRVPLLALGDQLIVIEAIVGWEPAFNTGLPARDLYEIVIAKPRYAPQVLWGGGTGT